MPPEYHDFCQVYSKARATSLPPHRPYDCAIDLLPGTSPPKGCLYSLSEPERKVIETYINDSLAAGIICPSTSPARAGFFFVEKDKTLRPCIDYRGLNDITIKNRYPLPLISTAFELLQGATIFSKLDLRNAYHLIHIREGDEWKTAFNTPTGHYEYLVMPFGLTNAPGVFQAMINDVLRDSLNRYVFVCLDDILIFSRSKEQHSHHVQSVLQRLLENSLYVKAEKCEFHVSSVSVLGNVVAQGNIQMDPAKVSAVTSWPVPENCKQLQRFLGFAKFDRRFICNYSSLAAPLTALTSSKVPFQWSPPAAAAFLTIILTIVDRFIKMVHFAPLSKLPTAKETAQLVLLHVFCLHGLPMDVVSDRGPQFSSVFWREFCSLLGATASLDSTPRAMDGLSARTKNWKLPYGAWPPRTPHPGRHNYCGLNMLTTPLSALPPASLYFSVDTAINHHCSQPMRRRFPALLSKPSSTVAAEHGSKLAPLSLIPWVAKLPLPTDAIHLHLPTKKVSKCGSPPETYLFGWSPERWHQSSSGLS